jgi:hypothetical protein
VTGVTALRLEEEHHNIGLPHRGVCHEKSNHHRRAGICSGCRRLCGGEYVSRNRVDCRCINRCRASILIAQCGMRRRQIKGEPSAGSKPRGLAKVAVSPNDIRFEIGLLPLCTHLPRRVIVAKRIRRQRGSAVERLRQNRYPLGSEFALTAGRRYIPP